ncbi:hypothetical protein [Acidisphaera sp. L21]|uniref:hypothetical protein n=1 Tax=Acidisphaera sp. L21 TaxID=1641851 RepID=UPI00131E55AD|nr:hypothetical protein [Acidisphaera sp. L21]
MRDRTISDPRPRTIEILRSIQAEAGGIVGPVFRQPNGEPYASAGALGAAVNPILKELAKECGHKDWSKVTLHTLRHTAATWHLLLTGKMDDVVRRFDWDEKKSAKRYVKNAPYQLAPEAAAFLGLTPKEPRQVWG